MPFDFGWQLPNRGALTHRMEGAATRIRICCADPGGSPTTLIPYFHQAHSSFPIVFDFRFFFVEEAGLYRSSGLGRLVPTPAIER